MKYAGSIALRSPSRKGLFERMIAGLHRSRRRQARHLVRHYRYLVAEGSLCQRASGFPDVAFEREDNRNANGDQASIRANHRAGAEA
jgi:hypothetical protein